MLFDERIDVDQDGVSEDTLLCNNFRSRGVDWWRDAVDQNCLPAG